MCICRRFLVFSPPLCLYKLAEDLVKCRICLSLAKLPVYRRWGKSSQSSRSPGKAFLVLTDELERLRRRRALSHHPLAIKTMCQFLIPTINARPKTCAGCMGNDGNFDIVGHHLDILNLTAMSSSSPLD